MKWRKSTRFNAFCDPKRSSCAGMHIASSYYESDTELDTLAMKWSLVQTGK